MREQLERFLNEKGWEKDRWGHYTKTTNGKKYRMKFQARSLRLEVQCHHEGTQYSPASNSWVRIRSAHYGKISIKDGKICGMSFAF